MLKENSDYKLTNLSTVKPKTLVFAKNGNCKYYSIEEFINELQSYGDVNASAKVNGMLEIINIRNLSLKAFTVTIINITMIGDLITT